MNSSIFCLNLLGLNQQNESLELRHEPQQLNLKTSSLIVLLSLIFCSCAPSPDQLAQLSGRNDEPVIQRQIPTPLTVNTLAPVISNHVKKNVKSFYLQFSSPLDESTLSTQRFSLRSVNPVSSTTTTLNSIFQEIQVNAVRGQILIPLALSSTQSLSPGLYRLTIMASPENPIRGMHSENWDDSEMISPAIFDFQVDSDDYVIGDTNHWTISFPKASQQSFPLAPLASIRGNLTTSEILDPRFLPQILIRDLTQKITNNIDLSSSLRIDWNSQENNSTLNFQFLRQSWEVVPPLDHLLALSIPTYPLGNPDLPNFHLVNLYGQDVGTPGDQAFWERRVTRGPAGPLTIQQTNIDASTGILMDRELRIQFSLPLLITGIKPSNIRLTTFETTTPFSPGQGPATGTSRGPSSPVDTENLLDLYDPNTNTLTIRLREGTDFDRTSSNRWYELTLSQNVKDLYSYDAGRMFDGTIQLASDQGHTTLGILPPLITARSPSDPVIRILFKTHP